MVYCRIPLVDGSGNSPAWIDAAIRCLVMLIDGEFRVLVACSAGMSRSPAIVAAALAVVTQRPPAECLVTITSDAPHDVSPLLWSEVMGAYDPIRASLPVVSARPFLPPS